MEKINLKGEIRNITGRKTKTLRRSGFVPGIIYGRGFTPISIQVPQKDFEKVYTEAGESTLVYLSVDGENYPTIIHDVVRNPITEKLEHADFYKVRLDEKIKAKVPVVFVGEAPAVKSLGGILVKNVSELEVEGLPQDLPNKISVDISGLAAFNSNVLLKNLDLPKGVAFTAKPEDIVALIQEPISEEELKAQLETPATASPEEVEVIKKEKPEAEATEETGAEKSASPAKE